MTTTTDPITTVDDTTLARWVNDAYWEAARSWNELHKTLSQAGYVPLAMRRDAARSADDYYVHVKAEQTRRRAAVEFCAICGIAPKVHVSSTAGHIYTIGA